MDLILVGGNILTMDKLGHNFEGIAVKGQRIAAIGANEEVSKLGNPNTKYIDLHGRTVIPGFVDPHNHFSFTTFQPVSVDCRVPPHTSIRGILETIAASASTAPKGRIIWGWGFRGTLLNESRNITRWELDEVSPHNPVVILDGSCHACYVNSAALKLAGIGRGSPQPKNGEIRNDSKGEPNGTMWETAMDPFYDLSFKAYQDIYQDGVDDLVLHNSMRHLSYGITSIGDACTVPLASKMYQNADSQGKLPLLMHQMLAGDGFFAPPEKPSRGEIHDGNVSDRLRGGTIKMFMDPVFPEPASIRFDGHGHQENVGSRYYSQEEADILVMDAHRRGLQVAIHCLGTWSIDQALNSFERALRELPKSEPRFRIEHFSLPTLDQIRRTKSLGVTPVVQPPFVYTNGEISRERARIMGGDVRLFPFKTMLSEGLAISASSDSPCAPPEPMIGLHAIVTRNTREGSEPLALEEAVTPMEGLQMYTINAAYAMSRENEIGSLEVGKRADMAVLSHDPTVVSQDFIRDINIDKTFVDGRIMYER